MLKLFKRKKERVVDFCDRCGAVCDSSCRANAIYDRAWDKVFHGVRFS